METLQNAYRDDDIEPDSISPDPNPIPDPNPNSESMLTDNPPSESYPETDPIAVESAALTSTAEPGLYSGPGTMPELLRWEGSRKLENLGSEEAFLTDPISDENCVKKSAIDDIREVAEAKNSELDEFLDSPPSKMQKSTHIDQLVTTTPLSTEVNGNGNGNGSKKSVKKKSKNNSVWTKSTRKGKKRAKHLHSNSNNRNNGSGQTTPIPGDAVLLMPALRYPEKNEDSHEAKICLSKLYKAEKVELSDDRLSASSSKGYRMVRATRGVSEGAWFFEIKVVHLGETGHVRLGWTTDKGDLQAPVGYDGCSFGYRDVDGSKVHKALRETYGEEGYKEGDVIGFYINLPEGHLFAPKGPRLVLYNGQKYICDSKEEPLKSVPGSEISYFKNGVCQGVAFKDLYGGIYYPAASMYTLPNQPNCVVKFNFGPDFECFPTDFGGRPVPRPMIEVPYLCSDSQFENGVLEENKR